MSDIVVKEFRPQDIRDLRKRLGLSQVEFAQVLGVSKWCVAHWEQGNRTPDARRYRILLSLELSK